jgi:hypothetical protein
VAQRRRIRHVDVGDAAAGGRVDLADIPLDPVAVAQRIFSGTGTTVMVRDLLPSAFGPTVMSMALLAVFSNALYRLVGACSGRPSTASRYSPALTFRPGSVSGARKAGFQFRPP